MKWKYKKQEENEARVNKTSYSIQRSKGEGVGMILGLELIREERQAKGMATMGVDNVAAIIATHAIKPGPGHHVQDLFHKRIRIIKTWTYQSNVLSI